MSAPSRRSKVAWLVGLGLILGAWLYLQYRVTLAEEARYARQLLRVGRVQVEAPAQALTEAGRAALGEAVSEALAPQLSALSACLVTADGTRAPATLTLSFVGAEGGGEPPSARWVASEALSAEVVGCLMAALPKGWPDAPAQAKAHVVLIPTASGDEVP